MSAALQIDREKVKDTDPLLLRVAAALAYPDGSMTAVGLRKLGDRGLLDIERVNGRDYTTLVAIREMRRKCLVHRKGLASTSEGVRVVRPSGKSGASERTSAQAALSLTVRELKDSLKKRSRSGTGPGAQVVPMRSTSRTS